MAKIPKFKSKEEEVKFWDEHTLDEFDEDLEPAEDITFVKPRKKLVSLRLDPYQIKTLKKIAAKKGIGYITLTRMWVTEKINETLKKIS